MWSKHGRVCTFINAEMSRGLFQAYTHIYFKHDFINQGPTREGRRGSKVDICPALTCCFSTAGQSYLLTTYLSITSELCYLLPVRQDVLFFSFSQNLIYSQKIISGALVGFLEYNYFLFSFLFYKKYFLLIPIRP